MPITAIPTTVALAAASFPADADAGHGKKPTLEAPKYPRDSGLILCLLLEYTRLYLSFYTCANVEHRPCNLACLSPPSKPSGIGASPVGPPPALRARLRGQPREASMKQASGPPETAKMAGIHDVSALPKYEHLSPTRRLVTDDELGIEKHGFSSKLAYRRSGWSWHSLLKWAGSLTDGITSALPGIPPSRTVYHQIQPSFPL